MTPLPDQKLLGSQKSKRFTTLLKRLKTGLKTFSQLLHIQTASSLAAAVVDHVHPAQPDLRESSLQAATFRDEDDATELLSLPEDEAATPPLDEAAGVESQCLPEVHNPSTLQTLPLDLLLAIFDHLDPTDYINIYSSSKALRLAAISPKSRHTIRKKYYGSMDFQGPEALPWLVTHIMKDPRVAPYPRSMTITGDVANSNHFCNDMGYEEWLQSAGIDRTYLSNIKDVHWGRLRRFVWTLPALAPQSREQLKSSYLSGRPQWDPLLLLPGLTNISLARPQVQSFRQFLYDSVLEQNRRERKEKLVIHRAPLSYPKKMPTLRFGFLTRIEILATGDNDNSIDSLPWLLFYSQLPSLTTIVARNTFSNPLGNGMNQPPRQWRVPKVKLTDCIRLDTTSAGFLGEVRSRKQFGTVNILDYRQTPDDYAKAVASKRRFSHTRYESLKQGLLRMPSHQLLRTLESNDMINVSMNPQVQLEPSHLVTTSGVIERLYVIGNFTKIDLTLLFEPQRKFSGRVPLQYCLVLVGYNMDTGIEEDRAVDVTLKFAG